MLLCPMGWKAAVLIWSLVVHVAFGLAILFPLTETITGKHLGLSPHISVLPSCSTKPLLNTEASAKLNRLSSACNQDNGLASAS